MNGVMIPLVSAGSNQVGASETCTAHVSCPSGAARVAAGVPSPASEATNRIRTRREIAEWRTRSVMGPPLPRDDSGAKPRTDERNPKCAAIIRGRRALSRRYPAWRRGAAREHEEDRAQCGHPGEDPESELVAAGAVGEDARDHGPADHAEHHDEGRDARDRAEGRAAEVVGADRRHQRAADAPRGPWSSANAATAENVVADAS